MTVNHAIPELETRYAKLLGRHKVAETRAESAIGLKAIAEADAEITLEKRKLQNQMEQIRRNIRTLHDPDWEPYHLKPMLPKPSEKHPQVAKRAYACRSASKA